MDRKIQIFIALISLFSSIVTGLIVGLLTKDAAIKSAEIQSNISRVNNENVIENSRNVLELEYKLKRKTEIEKERNILQNKETVAINYILAFIESHVTSLEHDYRILQMLAELDISKFANSVQHYDVKKTIDSIETLRNSLKNYNYKLSHLDNETTLRYIEQLPSQLQFLVFKYLLGIQNYRNSDLFDFSSKDIAQLVNIFSSPYVLEKEKREMSNVYIEKIINQSKKDILSRGYEIAYCLQFIKMLEEKAEIKNSQTDDNLLKYNKLNKNNSAKYKGLSF